MFIAGLTIYFYLPLRDMANPQLNYVRSYDGIDLKTQYGIWWMISGQAYRFFAFGYDLAGYLKEIISTGHRLWRNYTGVGVILGFIGAFFLVRQRQRFAIGMIISLVMVYGFYSGYAVADKGTMFLPVYVLWAILIAVGAHNSYKFAREFSIIWPNGTLKLGILVQGTLAGIAIMACWANWRWVDMSNTYGPELFGRQVLNTVSLDALVIGPWSSAVILEYFQEVEGLRPDVTIFNRSRYEVAEYHKLWAAGIPHEDAVTQIQVSERNLITSAYHERPVFDMEYDANLAAEFEYQPVGRVFQLAPK